METPQQPTCRNTTADTCSLTFMEYVRLETLARCLRETGKNQVSACQLNAVDFEELERFINGFDDKVWTSPAPTVFESTADAGFADLLN